MTPVRKTESPDEWMTLGDAGRALGRTRLAVLSMIARGELIESVRGRYTFVRRDSVDALIAARSESPSAA